MNKKALKEFAVYARNELRNQIALRAQAFGISSEGSPVLTTGADYLEINGKKLDLMYRNSLQKLLKEIEKKGYENVIEEVAYTWFNRLIAIRFMEVHNYLPSKVRVLSSETKGKIDPDILTEYQYADLPVDKEEVAKSIALGNREDAFRKLLVAQCNELHEIMPFLFEEVADYTELLLPESLLHADSLINKLGKELEDENFEQVEVIGWLYQYYISEKKDEVFAGLKKNKKITKENIPAATQLFTPHWIVRYMVENSLGQMWLESHPESNLKEDMKYYVEPAEQEAEVQAKLEELRNPNLSPEDITIMDPACGSGHILVYAFDLLYKIYEERGYPIREIPTLILEKNLYGIDIDDRAAQLASFALMMKAREKTKRVFKRLPNFNIISIQESNDVLINQASNLIGETSKESQELQDLFNTFINAKNFGSILQVKQLEFDKYLEKIDQLKIDGEPTFETFEVFEKLDFIKYIIKQAHMLSSKYDVVITNPPYMGAKGMNSDLSKYMKDNYKSTKADLFAAFMEKGSFFTKDHGFYSQINQHSWMFLNSFAEFRKFVLLNHTINSMLHLGTKTFEEIGGEVVQNTAFIIRKIITGSYKAKYYRLIEYKSSSKKRAAFENRTNEYILKQNSHLVIPEYPIAYWVTDKIREVIINNDNLKTEALIKKGMFTGNNDLFIRFWHEVLYNNVGFDIRNLEAAFDSGKKWFPTKKGGSFRRWAGNDFEVVAMDKESYMGIDKKNGHRSPNYYFKPSISWSSVTTNKFSARMAGYGYINNTASMSLFEKNIELEIILGLLNSKLTDVFLNELSPTINYTASDLERIPIVSLNESVKSKIKNIVKLNVNISKNEWIMFEEAWGFSKHPLLIYKKTSITLADSYANWEEHAKQQFFQLQQNEETLNKAFIELYGLQEELIETVPEQEITIRRADRVRDTKSFLSYCVGLIMGRYSLDAEGLVYAGGKWDVTKYQSFQPDQDGIIPLTDTVYFEDDIISRLQELLALMFGEDTLNENLQWLAESLTMKNNETPVERLRRYFFDEFYQDHCKVYQKRPIYWMAESGKKKGFRALFYLHRYTPETLATMRFSYVQNLQEKLTQEQKRLEQDLVNPDLKATTKKRYEKQLNIIKAQQDELVEFDKSLAELANQRIALDLDDGVVVNYAKLQNILAKIK